MQLLCIIQNLEQWIIDDFRPWVSRCISLHDTESDQGSEGEEGDDITSYEEEWEPDGIEGSDVNDTDQSEDDMEEEERMWDEVYIPSGGEEEDPESSELDSDDEDFVEYELDKGRVDSLMQELMQGVSQVCSHSSTSSISPSVLTCFIAISKGLAQICSEGIQQIYQSTERTWSPVSSISGLYPGTGLKAGSRKVKYSGKQLPRVPTQVQISSCHRGSRGLCLR